jgi:hypothetical protein
VSCVAIEALKEKKSVGYMRAADVLNDDTLSAAYGSRIQTNRTPPDGQPFVLPPAAFERPDPAICDV